MTEATSAKCKIVKAHCNHCLGERNHQLLFKHERSWHEDMDDDFFLSGDDHYELLQCCGCDSIILRHNSWFSEDYDDEGRPEKKTRYYPPAVSRKKPKFFNEVISIGETTLHNIEEMLDEVYIALQNGSYRLAAMGIRAIIETMMIDKVSDQNSFAGNLSELCNQGYVSKKQKDILTIVLDVGHAAMHRNYCPTPKELNNILDICESLIESLYFHEIKTKKLKDKIPPRATRVRAKKEKKGPSDTAGKS